MIIYKATNTVNNKIYVGCATRNLKRRISGHHQSAFTKNSKFVFHKALRKYGKEGFVWEIIHTCSSIEEMYDLETKLITETYSYNYNTTFGHDNTTLGLRMTDEQKEAQSKRVTGNGNPMYGKNHSDETKQKISEINKGRLLGDKNPSKRPEIREKISKTKMGELNPNAIKWVLTDPDGNVTIFTGGIKRILKSHGLTYSRMKNVLDGATEEYNGWKLTRG